MTRNKAIMAILVLIEHCAEKHPHFESPRGQKDIAKAKIALRVMTTYGLTFDEFRQLPKGALSRIWT